MLQYLVALHEKPELNVLCGAKEVRTTSLHWNSSINGKTETTDRFYQDGVDLNPLCEIMLRKDFLLNCKIL